MYIYIYFSRAFFLADETSPWEHVKKHMKLLGKKTFEPFQMTSPFVDLKTSNSKF